MARHKNSQPAQVDEEKIHVELAGRIVALRQEMAELTKLADGLQSCPGSPDVEQALKQVAEARQSVSRAEQILSERFQRVLCRTDTPYAGEGSIGQVSINMFGVKTELGRSGKE